MATRQNTIRYFPDASYVDLATNTTLGTATRFDSTVKTLTIAETGSRVFRSVILRAHFGDKFTVANEITGVRMGIKLGAAAAVDTDRTFTQANTGDHSREVWDIDVTSYFTTNFGAATTQTVICSLAISSTTASVIGGSIWFDLIITYEFDDSVGTTRTKSIPVLIQSLITAPGVAQVEVGSDGVNPVTNQIPALDTYLEEASKTYLDAAICWTANTGNVATNTQPFIQIDAVAEVAQGVIGQALQTQRKVEGCYNYPTGTHSTAAAHAFKMRSDTAATLQCAGAILWVTYTYNKATSTRGTFFGIVPMTMAGSDNTGPRSTVSPSSAVNADALVLHAELDIQEPGTITLKQSGAVLEHTNISGGTLSLWTAAQSPRVYTSLGTGWQHTIFHRCDNASGWTLSAGLNRLILRGVNSLIRRMTIEGMAFIVYSADVPSVGIEAGNRALEFYNASYSSTPANEYDIAASGAGQQPIVLTAPWKISGLLFSLVTRSTINGQIPQLMISASTGEIAGEGWAMSDIGSFALTSTELGCAERLVPMTRKYNPNSNLTGLLDPNTSRRQFIESTQVALFGWHTIVTVHNVTYKVSGTTSINGVALPNGSPIYIYEWTTTPGQDREQYECAVSAGSFSQEVFSRAKSYIAYYENSPDSYSSAPATASAAGGSHSITFVSGGGGDTTDPTITIVSTPVASTDPLVVSIYDASGFSLYQVTCKDRTDGKRLTVYDPMDGAGTLGFVHPFAGKSTITGSGTAIDPYILTIYRRGRWPTGLALDIRARAIDTKGNEVNV